MSWQFPPEGEGLLSPLPAPKGFGKRFSPGGGVSGRERCLEGGRGRTFVRGVGDGGSASLQFPQPLPHRKECPGR